MLTNLGSLRAFPWGLFAESQTKEGKLVGQAAPVIWLADAEEIKDIPFGEPIPETL